MVGVFVAFIRVVYGRTIYMSLPRWRFGIKSSGASSYTISIPLDIAASYHGADFHLY